MDRRAFKNLMTKRSTIWTLSLCMTGVIVLGGIAAVNKARRSGETDAETELGQMAYLEEEVPDDMEDDLFPVLDEEEELAQASGNAVEEDTDEESDRVIGTVDEEALEADGEEAEAAASAQVTDEASGEDGDTEAAAEEAGLDGETAEIADAEAAATAEEAQEASASNIISEQALLDAGVSFSTEDTLMWPSAGTVLIDYSMDGSVYFPTLNQYKYNPALVISSEMGNQVLASAKGIVESIGIDEETGTTLVLNIGNGYKLTYGQLKELAVTEGDVVEEGALLGYVSEPTKYYSEEGSNLYFAMTQDGEAVDPVMYLE
jgi:murein DD-endopeptidase MepM/ murein hydrolase activator NlpD